MIGIEYYLPMAIFCTLIVAFVLGVEVKRTIRQYKGAWDILGISVISVVFLSILLALWALTPVQIENVDIKTSDVSIVTIEKTQEITRYNGKNYLTALVGIDTVSVDVAQDSIKYKYKFGITVFGDTTFRSLE
jgi:hypothetical protein